MDCYERNEGGINEKRIKINADGVLYGAPRLNNDGVGN